MTSMQELKEGILADKEAGVDFGCRCRYCGADPAELVERGDAIPVIYGREKEKQFCFRCSDSGRYACRPGYLDDETYEKLLDDFYPPRSKE